MAVPCKVLFSTGIGGSCRWRTFSQVAILLDIQRNAMNCDGIINAVRLG